MRLWYAAAFVLIACGGKIATESTGTTTGPGPHHIGGDDDDDTPSAPPTSGPSSSGYSSGAVPPPSPPPPGPGPSSSSSSGLPCSNVSVGCGGIPEEGYTCSIYGPSGVQLSCSVAVGDPVAKCSCFGRDDAGTDDFVLKLSKSQRLKYSDLFAIWQKYCGGTCP